MKITNRNVLALAVAASLGVGSIAAWAGGDVLLDGQRTHFTNIDSIANTRHNLTQSTLTSGGGAIMDLARNDYKEVCVYCHTPHGADTGVEAPLWNRTRTSSTYKLYSELGTATLSGTNTQPGPSSLTCLSCHDGTVGVDSIINMPGSGGYDATRVTVFSSASLNSWTGSPSNSHQTLSINGGGSCLICHAPSTGFPNALDFTVFALGTDLTNDHPVGISFPTPGTNPDFKTPSGNRNGTLFFDLNGNGIPNANEIRLYDSGEGPEVECASCHDPHGVPASGPGTQFAPTFLRVSNEGSDVCLTCHTK